MFDRARDSFGMVMVSAVSRSDAAGIGNCSWSFYMYKSKEAAALRLMKPALLAAALGCAGSAWALARELLNSSLS